MKYNIKGILILRPFRANSVFRESFEHDTDTNQLEGMSSDFYGNSTIKGTWDLRTGDLKFDKIYKNGVKMRYSMIKGMFPSPEGAFFGEVFTEGVEMPYSEVMCEIFQEEKPRFNWEERARTAEMSSEGIEKLTRITIEGMEKKGYVKISTDKDGEKIVRLTPRGENDLLLK